MKRPNILYIMSDDHSAQAISIYQSRLSKVFQTPNIDRIGREGAAPIRKTGGDRQLPARQPRVELLLLALDDGVDSGVVERLLEDGERLVNVDHAVHQRDIVLGDDIGVLFQYTQSVTTKGILRGGGDTKFLMVARMESLRRADSRPEALPRSPFFGITPAAD